VTRFRFRLERVLRARRAAEQMQRAQLAEAERGARRAEETAQSCTGAVLAARADVRAEQSAQSLDPTWIVVAQDAHDRMSVVERRRIADAAAARDVAASERRTWRALRADVRGLERLEARGREHLREEVATREERAIEEFAARQAEERRRKGSRR
jgi:flagellar biosynthesis chaperone FliJ